MNMNELIGKVEKWAEDKGILDNTGAERQLLKAMSELGELADEVLKGNREKQRMEMGDVLVTLVCVSSKLNLNMTDCLAAAYEKISNRKGTTVNGIFIKEGDTYSAKEEGSKAS